MTHTTRARFAFACTALLVAASSALAQLTPDRMFYGVDRKAPMTVEANGDVENRIGVALVTAKGLLLQCGGDIFIWSPAFNHAMKLINLLPLAGGDPPMLRELLEVHEPVRVRVEVSELAEHEVEVRRQRRR